MTFGKFVGLYQLFYLFAPGWGLFRGQERTIVWVVLAAALLAGYGAAWLAQHWAAARPDRKHAPPEPIEEAFRQAQGPGRRDPDVLAAARPGDKLAYAYGVSALVALILALAFFVGYEAGREALWGFTSATLWLALLLTLTAVALRARQPALLIALLLLDLFTANPGHHSAPPRPLELAARTVTGGVRPG